MAIHNNGEPKPNPYGTDSYEERYEGSTSLFAKHLVEDHGYKAEDVDDHGRGITQSDWIALSVMHKRARLMPDMQNLTNNGEKPGPRHDTDFHDHEFKNSPEAYAKHLVEDHGYKAEDVDPFIGKSFTSYFNENSLHTLHHIARAKQA